MVIPAYNVEAYLEECLGSVAAQSWEDWEAIVVDDGSTDGSFQMADAAAAAYPQCRIVRQANGGVAAARNRGVELAEGEYVCFLDADDWWEPPFLEEVQNLIAACPEAGLYGTGFYIVKNGKKRVAPIGVDKGFRQGYIDYCQTYARTLCMPITSSSVAVPRDVFIQSRGFKSGISLGEDFDLWIRIALQHKVALVNLPLADYYQDLPPGKRATRRLRTPQSHMLWNLDYLAAEESRNADLKRLLDRLRASGLFRFYLSRQYHDAALLQLSKVDWSNISKSTYKLYHSPLWWQRVRFSFRTGAASVKSLLLKSRQNS